MKYSIILLLATAVYVQTAPADVSGSLSASAGGIPAPISFENGNVNVNFAGFKASAGLGGLITGNAAHGGLQASAETPFGQKAAAGLAGVADGNGGPTSGGLYAGATAGNNVGAGAALGGSVDGSGSHSGGLTSGGLYAGATAGGNVGAGASLGGSVDGSGSYSGIKSAGASSGASGVYKVDTKFNTPSGEQVVVTKEEIPATAVRSFETKHEEPANVQTYQIHKQISYQPVVTRTKTITREEIHEQPQTVITKQVQTQPAQTVYYKTRFRSRPHHHHWHKFVTFNAGLNNDAHLRSFVNVPAEHKEVHTVTNVAPPPSQTHIVKEVQYGQQKPIRQEYTFQNVAQPPFPFFGQFSASGVAHAGAAGAQTANEQGVIAAKTNSYGSSKTAQVNYASNARTGEVINDIFNIPIQTLSAVNRLVGNIVGGGGTSVHVNKQLRIN